MSNFKIQGAPPFLPPPFWPSTVFTGEAKPHTPTLLHQVVYNRFLIIWDRLQHVFMAVATFL